MKFNPNIIMKLKHLVVKGSLMLSKPGSTIPVLIFSLEFICPSEDGKFPWCRCSSLLTVIGGVVESSQVNVWIFPYWALILLGEMGGALGWVEKTIYCGWTWLEYIYLKIYLLLKWCALPIVEASKCCEICSCEIPIAMVSP